MANAIRIKRSHSAGVVPASLAEGEIAANTSDARFWVGDNSGAPIELGAGSTGAMERFFANKSSDTSLTSSFADVTGWDAANEETGPFSWNATTGELTINIAGVYMLGYSVGNDNVNGGRHETGVRLSRDTGSGYSAVGVSERWIYSRNKAQGRGTAAFTWIVTVTAGEKFKLQGAWSGGETKLVGNRQALYALALTGAMGPKGDKGDTGDTGPKGDKGDKGDPGPQGVKGDKGDPGEDGADGADGTQPDVVNAWTRQQYIPEVTLTAGANVSWNLNTQPVARLTLDQNTVLDNPSSMQAGGFYQLRVIAGTYTLSYGSAYRWPGGSVPSVAGTTLLTFYSDGTYMYGTSQLDYS